jgi:asparagine synthase (glutamine-hydrolysing)
MCGIAGALSALPISIESRSVLTDALHHRGPDATGGYVANDARLFLGHCRLSIIDLSGSANQPMYSADGHYVMVYNGEVYNFEELRDQYLKGYNFRTHSDTEVILELFAKYGVKSIAWLNGMFTFAIHDKERDEVILARDGIGIKPLFYYSNGAELVFGSELKAVRDFVSGAMGRRLEVASEAIPYFLHVGFIPEPLSIYKNVYKFPSGHYAIVSGKGGKVQPVPFWQPKDSFLHDPIQDEQTAYSQYRSLLFDAVDKQMIADVPLGTFLSGGIDSSLVTAVAAHLSSRPVKTFSIGFEEARYDESRYAAEVAIHLGTEHHPFKVSINEVLGLIPNLLNVYDEPFADSSAFPTMLVSRLARQYVTVTLSGDGGDELFQGYGMYNWATRLQSPMVRALHNPMYAASQFMGARYQRAGTLFNYSSRDRLHSHIFSQEQYFFSERELKGLLLEQTHDFTSLNALDVPSERGTAAERQAYWDLTHYLKDDLLVKVDRASMQYSLESRVPLLDTRLVAFAMNLDYNLKVREGWGTKYLMKRVLYDLVPQTIFERPKRGFAIPLQEWLQGPLAYLISDYLSPAVVERYGIVKPTAVERLLQQFRSGRHYLYNRIWTLVLLHWWLTEHEK